MNSSQMEMLSVKSTVERTLNGYAISHLSDNDVTPQQRVNNFFNDVERYVAMLFVSGQIDNNYLVRSTHQGIEVKFTTRGQYTCVNFLLPEELRWTVRKMISRKTEYETIAYKEAYVDTKPGTYGNITVDPKDYIGDVRNMVTELEEFNKYSPDDFLDFETAHNGREDALGHLTAAEEDALKTVLLKDTKWSILPDEVGNIKS